MVMARALSTSQVAVLAMTAGFAISNNFTLQPLLPEVLRGFGTPSAGAGWLAGAAPLGYTLGMVLLVPLGDQFDLRTLIIRQLLGLAGAILMVCGAPTYAVLVAGSVLVGLLATAAAQCAALGARRAGARRGFVIGTISAGISIGILMGRTLGGAVGQEFGWRAMEATMVALVLGSALLMRAGLDPDPPKRSSLSYGALLRSLPASLAESRVLRLSTVAGSAWFCMFSSIWPGLSLHLAAPPMSYGPAAAGLFGLIGVAGALAAQVGGRATDRFGASPVIACSMLLALSGVSTMAVFSTSVTGLAFGILLMDIGCFTAQAANQVIVLSVNPAKRNTSYSAYMVCYYILGTLGAFLGPVVIILYGWLCLMAVSAALIVTAIIAIFFSSKEKRKVLHSMGTV